MKTSHITSSTQNQSGFTLIELVMIIVILGILSAVAAPRFLDISGDAKRAASDNHHGSIQSAMSLAFAQHRAKGMDASTAEMPFVTDCATLKGYLEGDDFPAETTCAGSEITFPDGKKSTITAETATARASLSDKS